MDAERTLGLFFEPGLQAWAQGEDWISTGANWMYINSHFVVTSALLVWLYIARNHAFYYVRNMFMVAMGLALVGYMAYPTAPPGSCPSGASRTRSPPSWAVPPSRAPTSLYNPYAAVPRMHVAFALMIGIPGVPGRNRAASRSPGSSTRCS